MNGKSSAQCRSQLRPVTNERCLDVVYRQRPTFSPGRPAGDPHSLLDVGPGQASGLARQVEDGCIHRRRHERLFDRP
jgi:hypothetical protein